MDMIWGFLLRGKGFGFGVAGGVKGKGSKITKYSKNFIRTSPYYRGTGSTASG